MFVQFIHQRTDVVFLEVLEAPLQYAAAVGMCRKLIHVTLERADKCQPLSSDALYELLNDLNDNN